MSTLDPLRPDLIASTVREWFQMNMVVVTTPHGRKLMRCGYVGNDNYFEHATWLQVPISNPFSLRPPHFISLLHDKLDPFLSVCIGILNIDDMTFHEDTLAVYSGGVSEVISHLRYTLSAPPSIPSPGQQHSQDVGVLLQGDFKRACKNFATLQETLPFSAGAQHPFHVLRSVERGRLTFHHCLTKQPKINPYLTATRTRYTGQELQFFDNHPTFFMSEHDLVPEELSTSYIVADHPERYRHDANVVSDQVASFHEIENRYLDMRDIPTLMDGALVRVEFRMCGENSNSLVAQASKLVLLYPRLL